jgi:3-oxoacyl-[acyl-carrier protein] reductase
VTGSSRGIGKAIAISLGKLGCDIAVNYVENHDKAKEVEREIQKLGRQTMCICADVSKEEDVLRLYNTVMNYFPHLDILINNAGVHQHLKSDELAIHDWEKIIDINLTGAFLCCRAFIPHLKVNNYGRIVNISSAVAYTGTDHECHYASSKAGILGLTKSLALELAPYAVTVNAIAPGFIETDMTRFQSQQQRETVEGTIPLERLGVPEEIAYATCFLVSDKAGYITGETLNVNGGLTFR